MDHLRTESPPTVPLSQDAALVTALAGTAMPFAQSTEDQVDRWLRAIRLHGQVGAAMQALGVGEAALDGRMDSDAPLATTPPDPDAAERVVARAGELASERDATTTSTADILFALFDVYGTLMERALYERGASREELSARLVEMDERAEAAAL